MRIRPYIRGVSVPVVSDLSAGDLQVNYGAIRGIDKHIGKRYNHAYTKAASL